MNLKKSFFTALCMTIFALAAQAQVMEYVGMTQDSLGDTGNITLAITQNNKYAVATDRNNNQVHVYERDTITGTLTHLAKYVNGQNGIAGLDGPQDVLITSNGDFVYIASFTGDAVVVFSMDVATGVLTYLENHVDGQGGVDGLNAAWGMALSPNEDYFYVAGKSDDAVSVFSRDILTGSLTYIESHFNGQGGVTGLNGSQNLVVSADGNHVYVGAAADGTIALFDRNSSTGVLTFNTTFPAVDFRHLLISSDDTHFYATTPTDSSISHYARNTTTGALTLLDNYKNPLFAPLHLAMNSSETLVVGNRTTDDRILVFERNTSTGALTFSENHQNNQSGITDMAYPQWGTFSPDNKYFYVTATNATFNSAIHIFKDTTSTPVGVKELSAPQSSFLVYPNPAQNQITIDFAATTTDPVQIELFDVTGKLWRSENRFAQMGQNQFTLNTEQISSGMYYLRVGTETQLIQIQR